MANKKRAKVRSVSTGLSQKELSAIVKTTARVARECSKAEDQRLKEFVANNVVAYKI